VAYGLTTAIQNGGLALLPLLAAAIYKVETREGEREGGEDHVDFGSTATVYISLLDNSPSSLPFSPSPPPSLPRSGGGLPLPPSRGAPVCVLGRGGRLLWPPSQLPGRAVGREGGRKAGREGRVHQVESLLISLTPTDDFLLSPSLPPSLRSADHILNRPQWAGGGGAGGGKVGKAGGRSGGKRKKKKEPLLHEVVEGVKVPVPASSSPIYV